MGEGFQFEVFGFRRGAVSFPKTEHRTPKTRSLRQRCLDRRLPAEQTSRAVGFDTEFPLVGVVFEVAAFSL